MNAPICMFTYNRLFETQRTIETLKKNYLAADSDLIVFSDGPKNDASIDQINQVRNYLQQITGFKSVRINESISNKGLANSVISGVSKVFEEYKNVIVLEDDLLTTPNFLSFMNQALDYYKNDLKIQTICGYSFYLKNLSESDVYFQKRPFSWGWATWKNRWDENVFSKEQIREEIKSDSVDLKIFNKEFGKDISGMLLDSLYNKNDSWYARWTYNHFKNNTYSVYPSFSLVENIGHGADSSTHCKGINSYTYHLDKGKNVNFKFKPFTGLNIKETVQFNKYFTYKHKILFRVKLLSSSQGRAELLSELKMRTFKVLKKLQKNRLNLWN